MKNKFLLSFYSITVFLSLSCEEVVNPPELQGVENRLVVNSILNPVDVVHLVEVTWSNPSFGELPNFGDEIVRNAEVSITDGNLVGFFDFDENIGMYSLDAEEFPLQAGNTYQLNVIVGEDEVSSSVRLREQISEVDFELKEDLSLLVKWRDLAGASDFYRVEAFLKPFFQNSQPYLFDTDFISDNNRDGSILQDLGEGFREAMGRDSVIITIYHFDELQVEYSRILQNFIRGDPFSEPVQLPTNIEGGLGIFAIVQQSDFRMKAL